MIQYLGSKIFRFRVKPEFCALHRFLFRHRTLCVEIREMPLLELKYIMIFAINEKLDIFWLSILLKTFKCYTINFFLYYNLETTNWDSKHIFKLFTNNIYNLSFSELLLFSSNCKTAFLFRLYKITIFYFIFL